jgi:hypothetical protein
MEETKDEQIINDIKHRLENYTRRINDDAIKKEFYELTLYLVAKRLNVNPFNIEIDMMIENFNNIKQRIKL